MSLRPITKATLFKRVQAQAQITIFVSTDHTSNATEDPTGPNEASNWTLLISGTYTTSNETKQYAFFLGVSSN